MAVGMAVTGAFRSGVFTRIRSLATAGINKMIVRAPRQKMDSTSLTLGKILRNPRMHNMPAPNFPQLSSVMHMQIRGGYGSSPSTPVKYQVGLPFFTFSKTFGLDPNHLSSSGISLALHKGRHTNLI